MKLLKDYISEFIARTCVICVGISYFFFLFAQLLKEDVLAITFGQYLLLFIFSILLSLSGFLFRLPLPKPLVVFIHYATTAVVFFVTFTAADKLSFPTTASFFIAVVLFTAVYALIFALYALFKLLLNRFASKEIKEKAVAEKSSYEKRF